MRRTGLAHSDGAGSGTSSMRKSPFGSSGTPVKVVLRSTKEPEGSQINVAKTLWLAFCPMLSPAARSNPRPFTLILPSEKTVAVRSAILQGPAGRTPRTMFRTTFGNVPSGLGVPATFKTGCDTNAAFEPGQNVGVSPDMCECHGRQNDCCLFQHLRTFRFRLVFACTLHFDRKEQVETLLPASPGKDGHEQHSCGTNRGVSVSSANRAFRIRIDAHLVLAERVT